ncbi:MAG: winged helix-turn-helix domain-containing protein [Acidobacteria bacterium]|nr:winged helix-turn-helix domain-containing protein [Acidobacteriota bacterium]
MMPAKSTDAVEFGPFRLYVRHRKLLCGREEVHLGGRAMDVLLALARKKGELVTKEQLFEAAWPNVSVHESNLKVTIATLRRALRECSPSYEYITTVVGQGYSLGPDASPQEFRVHASPPATAAGFPLPELGTVIGRDIEIAQLRDVVARNRLTAIVGAGGIGKTTVAVAVAHLFEDEGGGEVTFIDLARVASQEFVTPSLAAALGISADSNDSLHAIVSILARRKVLLVLDTCEHVRNVVAHICDVVLAKTPDVRILATSREVLRGRDEQVVWLEPLESPPANHADTAADVLRYAAPQLLAARTFEKSGYCVTDADARAIAAICRRLDGAPLAIELVSSRLAVRSADAVLEELDDRFDNLRREAPGGPLRQQTLLVTLEWSYALLTKNEATVLRAVSHFAGAFDTEGVLRVVAHHRMAPIDTFDAIAGLRAKSMLSVDQTTGDLRYRMLDSTRAFASRLLEVHGELAAVSASHARLQLDILNHAGEVHATMPPHKWHATYAAQADDLRKALQWSLHRANDARLGIELAAAGLPLWRELSLAVESHTNCERALAEFARIGCTDARLRLKLIVGLATSTIYLAADPARTVALLETALQLARETADAHAECQILGALAMYPLRPGRGGEIADTLQEMREAAVRTKDRTALWEQEHLCAEWDTLSCNFSSARERVEKLCAEMRDFPRGPVARFHVDQEARAKVLSAALHFLVGKQAAAVSATEIAARAVLETGHGLTVIHCLAHGIVFVMIECQEYEKARLYADILKDTVYHHGMAAWIPIADCYDEAVAALSGSRRDPESLRTVFKSLQQGLSQIGYHSYYATIAAAMVAIGQPDDAARIVDFVFHLGPQRWILPEFLRLRAATERAFDRDADAETTLRASLEAADNVGILPWKLRSAIDLATLLKDHDSSTDARRVLSAVYGQFTEGFDFGDLRTSRQLLDQLR